MMDYTGTKQRWERALVVPPPRNPLRGFLLVAGLHQSSRPPAQVRLLRTVKDAQLMGVRSCAVERGRRTPGFFFVTLFHCRHTQKRNRTTTQNWTMLFLSGVGAARGFLLLLPGAQLGFLPARGGDKRVGRCYCGVLKGKKLLME